MHDETGYSSSFDHLIAEAEFVRLKARRISAERQLRDLETDPPPTRGRIGRVDTTAAKEWRRRLSLLTTEEATARATLDVRVALNRQRGPELALDAVLREHGLQDDAVARAALVLAFVPTLGSDWAESCLDGLTTGAFGCGGRSSVQCLWNYLELSPEARIASRVSLLPTSPLVRDGLVSMVFYPSSSPAHFPSADLELATATFARLVERPELATPVKETDGKDG